MHSAMNIKMGNFPYTYCITLIVTTNLGQAIGSCRTSVKIWTCSINLLQAKLRYRHFKNIIKVQLSQFPEAYSSSGFFSGKPHDCKELQPLY